MLRCGPVVCTTADQASVATLVRPCVLVWPRVRHRWLENPVEITMQNGFVHMRTTTAARGVPATAVHHRSWFDRQRAASRARAHRRHRQQHTAAHAAEALSSACCAMVTPSALATSQSRARLVER